MGGNMMTAMPASATTLLLDLTRCGIELRAAGGRLQFRPRTAMTPELTKRVTAHKRELLTVLQGSQPAGFELRGPVLPVDAGERQIHRQEPGEPTYPPRLAECVAAGYVIVGWLPGSWAARLRQLADRCEKAWPELAGEYRDWAEKIELNGNSLA